ncbi:hypothetical protein HKX48_008639 [Thoreauomyces humboldtii]|nr:hypothetical protein HKX48_008639 [Thoreauomyces humboldtii]
MSVNRLLHHAFSKRPGHRPLSWQIISAAIGESAFTVPSSLGTKHGCSGRHKATFSPPRPRNFATFANSSPSSAPTTPAVTSSPSHDQGVEGSPSHQGADVAGLDAWRDHLRRAYSHPLSPTSAKSTWTHYLAHVRTHPEALAKLDPDDWFHLLAILGKRKSDQGPTFGERADVVLKDMELSGRAVDNRMFQEWARHADIRNLKDAEWFLRMVWWCAAPEAITDDLYATLIKILARIGDRRGVEELFRQAGKMKRVGDETNIRMAVSYCRFGAADKAMRLCVEAFRNRIDDRLCARLVRNCGPYRQPMDLAQALDVFDWAKTIGAAGTTTHEETMLVMCRSDQISAAEELLAGIAESRLKATTRMHNILLWAYTHAGRDSDAQGVVQRMQDHDVPPDAITFEAVMHGLGQQQKVEVAFTVFNRMQEMAPSAVPTTYTFNLILHLLLRAKRLDDAMDVLERMKVAGLEPDGYTYSTLMEGFTRIGRPEDALNVYQALTERGVVPDHTLSVSILSAYVAAGRIDEGVACLENFIREMHDTGVVHWTILMDAYLKQGNMDQAVRMFEKMVKDHHVADVVAYSIFVDAYARQDDFDGTSRTLLRMTANGVKPDVVVHNILIATHARAGRTREAFQALAKMNRAGLTPDVRTYTTLITAMAKDGDFAGCDRLLDEMEGKRTWPNDVTWIRLMDVSIRKGDPRSALRYFERMVRADADPARPHDASSNSQGRRGAVVNLIRGLVLLNSLDGAFRAFRILATTDATPSPSLCVVLIDALVAAREVAKAEAVYRTMVSEQDKLDRRARDGSRIARARASVLEAVRLQGGEEAVDVFLTREETRWAGVDADAELSLLVVASSSSSGTSQNID